eukprot:jgi/Tetstr1/439284/TSEL_027725.t1
MLRLLCDSTLEVTDGPARFNANDGYLVGLPEHVQPALHAFRTSIKASVGLEVRSDKMLAYIAYMEAALHETPADTEWPELDGHRGTPVLNVPLGSPECVHAYMRGKAAEELREEVDGGGWMRWRWMPPSSRRSSGCCLGVSIDPSTYGTGTNPVVIDFLAELLHDPDPKAAEAATLSEDAVARARNNKLHLPTRLKGTGIRSMATARDAACIGRMNDILPSYAATVVRKAWGRLQAVAAGPLNDADACVMEREEAASGSQKELMAFLYNANNSRLRNEVCALPITCRERILFNQLDAASGMCTVGIPTARNGHDSA